MTVFDDHQGEMPGDTPHDDLPDQELDDLDWLGNQEWTGDQDWRSMFVLDVRFAVSGPAPEPSPELARALAAGFSTDNGDLLATAASNVHGPAPQVAGLPKWRKDPHMSTGFLAALVAKLGAIPTAAKAALATVTAVMTMTVAGAAANSLPSFAQGPVAGAINAVTPLNLPTGAATDAVTGATNNVTGALPDVSVPSGGPVGAGASLNTPAGSANANANVPVPTLPAHNDLPGLPDLPVPGLPGVPSLPALPACVTNLIPAGGAAPDPTALIGQLPSCIQEVLASSGLPVNVEQCVASVLGNLTGVLNPGSIGSLPNLNVSSCVPLDTTSCTSNTLAAASAVPDVKALLGSILGSMGGGTIPGLDQLPTGCAPIDVQACLTSITGALGTLPSGVGTFPQLNLSACMPTGLTSGIPGLGGGIPGLGGGIPFLPFG
ncbi:MAG: hypothetical protein QOI99_2324 [Actinomycetota bacterium]|nr:hypothetical protein [Actinomycetota bacterium]